MDLVVLHDGTPAAKGEDCYGVKPVRDNSPRNPFGRNTLLPPHPTSTHTSVCSTTPASSDLFPNCLAKVPLLPLMPEGGRKSEDKSMSSYMEGWPDPPACHYAQSGGRWKGSYLPLLLPLASVFGLGLSRHRRWDTTFARGRQELPTCHCVCLRFSWLFEKQISIYTPSVYKTLLIVPTRRERVRFLLYRPFTASCGLSD
jgi:hypothetical protein